MAFNIIQSRHRKSMWKKHKLLFENKIIIFFVFISYFHLSISKAVDISKSSDNENAIPNGLSVSSEKPSHPKYIFKNGSVQILDNICLSPSCIHTASKILRDMDPSVDPCDNFYKFTCGGFINSTVIPESTSSVNNFNSDDKVQQQLKLSLEEKSSLNELKAFKLAKHLYRTCINETAINKHGVQSLLKILKDFGGWPVLDDNSWRDNKFHWLKSGYKLRHIGYNTDYFMKIQQKIDPKNNSRQILNLDQASLGLPPKFLLKGVNNDIVNAYFNYMVNAAVVLGAKREYAEKDLLDSLMFEIQLANISLPVERRRNKTLLYNPMTIEKMAVKYPSISWKEYLNVLVKPYVEVNDNDEIIVISPEYVSQLEALIKVTPSRTLANYIMWSIVRESSSFLNNEIYEKELIFTSFLRGKIVRPPRWKECVKTVLNILPLSVNALYIKKYFDKDAKKNAVDMVSNIRKSFHQLLKTIDWMDETTRINALNKASSMEVYVGYVDELLDEHKLENYYSKLNLNGDNYLEVILNVSLFGMDNSFKKFRLPVDKHDWETHGKTSAANAYYAPIENSIQFPAGILQGVFFDKDRPKYMNYGAIGFVIGHEITHGFDDQGRQYDKDGNLKNWWDPITAKKFLDEAQCIIEQSNNFTIDEVGLNLNGQNIQGETIADNGGVKMAYLAYKDWASNNKPEYQLPGLSFTSTQMFWISAASMWCSVNRPEALRNKVETDFHGPSEFRVLGTFQNMPEFSIDFKCPQGSRMNSIKKCKVW